MVENISGRVIFIRCIYRSRFMSLRRLVCGTSMLLGNIQNSQVPLRDILAISIRGSIPRFAPKATLELSCEWMWRARVIVKYVIRTQTRSHRCIWCLRVVQKWYNRYPLEGLECHRLKIEKGTFIKSRQGLEPHHPTMEKGFALQRKDTQRPMGRSSIAYTHLVVYHKSVHYRHCITRKSHLVSRFHFKMLNRSSSIILLDVAVI